MQRALQVRVSGETKNRCIFSAYFHSGLSRTQQKTDRVHVEDSVEKMLAVPNRLQKVNGLSCSSHIFPYLRWGTVVKLKKLT